MSWYSVGNPQSDSGPPISNSAAFNLIADPLPILPKSYKNQHLIGNLPKFSYDDENCEPEPLGQINGKPQKEVVVNERDLLQYVKEAYTDSSLVYCKQPLELNADGEIVNDPIKLMVNIKKTDNQYTELPKKFNA